ncbi:hypothetical protein TPSD3_09190 [Thioflexithrix psekupsensis]|uniref:TIR domain-containing protein n=1 Tax=Thioflexithrix psekupsensis TaxID=1570016 RepID=A0A251XA66_9GAMM|nr:hypothetical protein TPSD3_09190 [Thioflexithrix psekupsensis]
MSNTVSNTLPHSSILSDKAQVFISYAWNEKDSEENERLVNQLQADLSQRNIEIIRDKQHLGYKGDIKQFMQQIGRGHYVIVILSDKYLKSKNCMFELVEIAKHGDFVDRIFPIVLSSANIYDPVILIDYIVHWEQEITRLEQAMKKVSAANLQGIRESIDNYTAIRAAIANLISIIANMNTLTPEMHQNSHFESLYRALQEKIEQDNAA